MLSSCFSGVVIKFRKSTAATDLFLYARMYYSLKLCPSLHHSIPSNSTCIWPISQPASLTSCMFCSSALFLFRGTEHQKSTAHFYSCCCNSTKEVSFFFPLPLLPDPLLASLLIVAKQSQRKVMNIQQHFQMGSHITNGIMLQSGQDSVSA